VDGEFAALPRPPGAPDFCPDGAAVDGVGDGDASWARTSAATGNSSSANAKNAKTTRTWRGVTKSTAMLFFSLLTPNKP
jgi:hypothetical protein